MTSRVEVFVRAPVPSLSNARLHWAARARMAKIQRESAQIMLRSVTADPPLPPLRITLTRRGLRRIDRDNNVAAMKHFQDGCADWLGVDDGSPLLDWQYAQETGRDQVPGVHIAVEVV